MFGKRRVPTRSDMSETVGAVSVTPEMHGTSLNPIL